MEENPSQNFVQYINLLLVYGINVSQKFMKPCTDVCVCEKYCEKLKASISKDKKNQSKPSTSWALKLLGPLFVSSNQSYQKYSANFFSLYLQFCRAVALNCTPSFPSTKLWEKFSCLRCTVIVIVCSSTTYLINKLEKMAHGETLLHWVF